MDDGSGRTYWFHQETRQSRWAKPDAAVVEKLEARLQAERVAKQQRLALRRAEMQEQEQRQQAAAHEAEAVRHDVKGCVASWARGKDIRRLLLTLHELLPDSMLSTPIADPPSTAQLDVKRGYRDAVKLVHPDRLSASLGARDRQLCESAFGILTDAFKAFKTNHAPTGAI